MGLAKLNELYKTVIIDHAQFPRHKGELADPTGEKRLKNPTCGDVIKVSVVVKDGQINDVAFDGSGCTISQASASLMTTVLIGKDVRTARKLILAFSKLISGDEIDDEDEELLGDAAIVGSVAEFPTRIKCAALAWHAMDEVLNEEGSGASD
ncbi:SUF system NifU family Fe-S cluster assembly protein [Lentilactobacillus hilgardii]|nr:SUF system NifU family Fe-S cluster assembly protein [Lentilactobacillus hilgardii]MCV3740994.1 SUF system NifU family Fe-S cluster assembly protein [Lentilactobacillus hilgardii]